MTSSFTFFPPNCILLLSYLITFFSLSYVVDELSKLAKCLNLGNEDLVWAKGAIGWSVYLALHSHYNTHFVKVPCSWNEKVTYKINVHCQWKPLGSSCVIRFMQKLSVCRPGSDTEILRNRNYFASYFSKALRNLGSSWMITIKRQQCCDFCLRH